MYCLDHNEHTRSYMHETHREGKKMPINRVLSVLSHSSRILTTHLWLKEEKKAGQNCTRTCMKEENHWKIR